jgi:hypothetical protein
MLQPEQENSSTARKSGSRPVCRAGRQAYLRFAEGVAVEEGDGERGRTNRTDGTYGRNERGGEVVVRLEGGGGMRLES